MEKKLHIIRTDEVSKEETGLPPAFSRRPLASKRRPGRRERGGQSKLRMGAGLSPSTPQHSDGAERTPTHVLRLL